MRTRAALQLAIVILLAGVSPAMANTIQLGSLVPLGACVPTTGTICTGPTSVSTFVAGIGTVTISGFSVYPNTPGNISVTLDSNTASQVPYLGIIGGNNDDEMDVQTDEVLQISFSQPVFVSTIDLNKLFTANVRGDTNVEIGAVNFLLGGSFLGTNFYQGTANGLLTVNNPFPNTKIDTLQFWAVPTSNILDASNSDFGVSALSATVPEPGTLVLLGSGLAALAARRRSRRTIS